MNKTLTVSIPHRLSQDQARARLQNGIADLKQRFSGNLANVEETWSGNTMNFRFTVMGQAVTGKVDVLADVVRLEVDLPWMLAMLAERIRPKVEQEGRRLLESR